MSTGEVRPEPEAGTAGKRVGLGRAKIEGTGLAGVGDVGAEVSDEALVELAWPASPSPSGVDGAPQPATTPIATSAAAPRVCMSFILVPPPRHSHYRRVQEA